MRGTRRPAPAARSCQRPPRDRAARLDNSVRRDRRASQDGRVSSRPRAPRRSSRQSSAACTRRATTRTAARKGSRRRAHRRRNRPAAFAQSIPPTTRDGDRGDMSREAARATRASRTCRCSRASGRAPQSMHRPIGNSASLMPTSSNATESSRYLGFEETFRRDALRRARDRRRNRRSRTLPRPVRLHRGEAARCCIPHRPRKAMHAMIGIADKVAGALAQMPLTVPRDKRRSAHNGRGIRIRATGCRTASARAGSRSSAAKQNRPREKPNNARRCALATCAG